MTDAGEFEAFVRRHQDMVYATALRLLANRTRQASKGFTTTDGAILARLQLPLVY